MNGTHDTTEACQVPPLWGPPQATLTYLRVANLERLLSVPPLPSVPNVMKLVIEGTDSVNPFVNVLHWSYTGGPPTDANMLGFATNFYNLYTAGWIPLMHPSTSWEKCTATDLSSPTGAQNEFVLHTAGTSTSGNIGRNSCFLVSKSILARYRGGHPRTYLPIGTDGNLANASTWDAGMVASVGTAWATFLAGFTATTFGATTTGLECIVSYINKMANPVPPYRRAVPVVYDVPVDGYTFQAELASQRRRIGRK